MVYNNYYVKVAIVQLTHDISNFEEIKKNF